MDHVTVITPVGCIGNRGVDKEALENAVVETKADAIAVDAGSIDCGPWYLGSGSQHSPQLDIEWDLDVILGAAVPRRIPVLIGSAGGSGARAHVDKTVDTMRRVAAQKGLHFRLAVIYSDVDPDILVRKAANGVVPGTTSLNDDSPLRVDDVKASNVIVGLMGVEPIIEALDAGADVVLAGRSCDSAVIAAYPIWKGFDWGLSYHMGDIMECGESAAEEIRPTLRALAHNRIPIIGRMEKECFYLRPALDSLACTPNSCLMHAFYERADVALSKLPGGTLDKSATHYVQHDTNTTKVWGSKFVNEPYSILLEGTKKVGHRMVLMVGLRNPRMIEQLDQILADIEAVSHKRFDEHGRFAIHWHRFGKDAVLKASEPLTNSRPTEVGLAVDVVADTWDLAHDVSHDLMTRIAFWRYPGRQTTAGNVAVTFSPGVLDGGDVYEFSVYHVLQTDDWKQMFKTEYIDV